VWLNKRLRALKEFLPLSTVKTGQMLEMLGLKKLVDHVLEGQVNFNDYSAEPPTAI
jgi:hypothetical protein